jgi:hypothetical protein
MYRSDPTSRSRRSNDIEVVCCTPCLSDSLRPGDDLTVYKLLGTTLRARAGLPASVHISPICHLDSGLYFAKGDDCRVKWAAGAFEALM